jgi:anti-sigma regulatory factor (Ser/Thr protein kinase)
MAPTAIDGSAATTLCHEALIYRTPVEYLDVLLPYLSEGLDAGKPTLVAVPGPNIELLRHGLDDAAAVTFVDMTMLGRNPARIIPAIGQFVGAHNDTSVRFIGEPIWPGRTTQEACEATRHEAMLNTVFADVAIDIMCPYDAGGLDPNAVADSWRTHPVVTDHTATHHSRDYDDPAQMYRGDEPLSKRPQHGVSTMPLATDDLSVARQFVRDHAIAYGLSAKQVQDMVIAANEIATNTIVHTAGPGMLRIWREADDVICEVQDSGHIDDPFAGRAAPDDRLDHGRGLWMANQLCDLVQLRSSGTGTTIRLQVTRTVS